jgi:hypothetical protein
VDVGKKLHNQISLSTATLLSARFPVLTPPGRIKDSNEVNHLADGGYYDNSAIITMLNIYKEIKPITKGDNIKFLLIFIRNSRNEPPSSLSSLYEEKTPLYAFYNSWSNKVNQETSGADHLINFFLHLSDSTKSGDRFISIQLPRYQNDNIPLGWFLSDSAATTIDKCLDSLKLGILKNDSTIEVISDYLKK